MVVGTYHPGTFLMRYYLKNFPYERAVQIPLSVGDVDAQDVYSQAPGGEMTTERIMTYIHECNHYIHDMSLSSCVADDYLIDENSAYVKAASEMCPHITYPIFGKDTINHNLIHIPEGWFNKMSSNLYIKDLFFDRHHSSSEVPKYYSLFGKRYLQLTEGKGLSYQELLEGYVYYKTANDLMSRARLTGKYDYIQKFKNKIQLYPYSFDEENSCINISRIYSNSSYVYHIARVIYMSVLKEFDWRKALSYLNNDWPKGYDEKDNIWSVLDCGFFLLLDIVLTIPPISYIPSLCENTELCLEDFSPVHRFLLAMHIIRENNGFPDATPGELYYITLFNMIAKNPKAKWLDYESTIYVWDNFFKKTLEVTGDTSAGYRYRMFRHKFSKFHKFFLNIPSEILKETTTPLFSLVRGGGLKILRQFGNHYMPYEGLFDVYELFKMPFVKWMEYDNVKDYIKQEMEHGQSLMREVVYRMISRNISDALMWRDHFTCCFYAEEYDKARQRGDSYNSKLSPHLFCRSMDKCKCCDIKDIQQLPKQNCAVREYLEKTHYNISNLKWR